METLELKAEKRALLGKGVNSLREGGLLPAELYGRGVENVHLALSTTDFDKVYRAGGENTIVNIKFGDESRPVLIHDVQMDPVSQQILAVDLYQVDLKEKIITNVPLEFVGESLAVEELEGVLIKALDEVEVEALPMNIPHSIEVDISVLDDFSKSISVSDLKVSGDFIIKTDPETGVASVAEPREEEEEPVEEMGVEDVLVEGEKKGEESGEGAEAEASSEEKPKE
ncbi:MAG: 50S ribosomal protein L25 [bacterium]|nr:50S ribosomal protein L25 [bacterium]MDZ4231262.1 50S ribosomal protein L25 [Patescibacteria group bacterium]